VQVSNFCIRTSQWKSCYVENVCLLFVCLLGVKLDNHLSFTEHIDDICKKVSQRIAVLKKIKRNLPLAERKLYFNALIKPIMLYGSCAWCTASEENVNRVSKLQKLLAAMENIT